MRLLIATRNAGKRREFEALLEGAFPPEVEFIDVVGWPDELPEVIEDAGTFEGNAIKKAVESAQAAGCCAMSEDSGLIVDALDGAPGVYSAHYAGPEADDAQNNARLLEALLGVPPERRQARYVSTICLAMPEDDALGQALLARLRPDDAEDIAPGPPARPGALGRHQGCVVGWWRGRVEGRIIDTPRGEGGFGYDPHFLIPKWDQTMAEVPLARKNSISHRARALADLAGALAAPNATPQET